MVTLKPVVVTADGSVNAGYRHIEFILSADFAGTINGATISGATIAIYGGDAAWGEKFGPVPYTISAGSALLTVY